MDARTPEMHGQENESEALVHILTDPNAEPIMLSYKFQENITDNFSKDLEIGAGGFGVVYMGIVRNMKVAIKKLFRIDDFSEKQFEAELQCLKRVKHKNIVRFLGYCSDTPKVAVEYNGALVLAECRKRFLCFEYVPNKNLEDYIKDESRQRDWNTRYYLIEGICRGLHYLHNKERINHLDLKPANILLDAGMVPKITDFGLSRRFSGEQSRIITEHVRGTPGYIAPEYIEKGEISFKTDIYSLGIIIRNLLMGRNDDLFDLESWHKSVGIVCSRAKTCIKIAQLCVDADQKRRPTIDNIIDMLHVKETLKDNPGFLVEQKRSDTIEPPRMDPGEMNFTSKASSSLSKLAGKEQSMAVSTPPLDNTCNNEVECNGATSKQVTEIYSLEFCFPFKPNKRLHCPMTLTNITGHYVGIWITPIGSNSRANKSLEDPFSFFLMKPNSTWVVTVKTKEQQQFPLLDTRKFKMMIIIIGSKHDLPKKESPLGDCHLLNKSLESPNGSLVRIFHLLNKLVIKESGGNLIPAMLSATIDNTANCKTVKTHQAMSPRHSEDIFCMAMDVHPTEPWIIMGHDRGLVSIWNYQTQQKVTEAFKMTTCGVCSVKFIARDQWFLVVAGDANGWVHVFNNSCFKTNKKLETFQAHPDKSVDSLAIHPTYPILLSSSYKDSVIKRWDWDQGWACTRIFEGHTSGVRYLAFNPKDTNNFTSIGADDDTKVWNINSSNAITPSSFKPEKVDHFSDRRHRHFLISCDNDQTETADIWDMQTKDRLQTLRVFMQSKLLKIEVGVNARDGGNSRDKKIGRGSEIPGQINNGKKDSGAKQSHGGRGDHTNNATGASSRGGAGYPGKGQMGGGPTSRPIGHIDGSMPPRHPLYEVAGTGYNVNTYVYKPVQYLNIFDDAFSDENPNSCSIM